MFDYRRTPWLALVYGAIIGFAVTWFVEDPARPLGAPQTVLFYALSYLPGLGLAMLGDPAPRRTKAEYMKFDYYAPGGPAMKAGARGAAGAHPESGRRDEEAFPCR